MPLFKCHPCLKTVILQHYGKINHLVPQPALIALPNLQKSLIRAEVKPTVEQVFDILWQLKNSSQNTSHKFAGTLPKLRKLPPLVKPCKNIRCNTCKHLCYLHKQHHQPELSYMIHCHVYLFEFNILDHVHQMQKAVRRTNNKTAKRPNKSSSFQHISEQNHIFMYTLQFS